MRSRNLWRIAVSTGLTTLALSVTGCSLVNGEGSSSGAGEVREAGRTHAGATIAKEGVAPAGTTLEFQTGSVIEASGSVDGVDVSVSVVDNSIHGSSITVELGGPESGGMGNAEQSQPYLRDGVLEAVVEVDGEPLRVAGRLAPHGQPKEVSERAQDSAGEPFRTRGTNTPLAGRVVIIHKGQRAALNLDRAMEYDLEVHRGLDDE